MSLELIKRAYDANAFTTDDTSAGYINPEYWDTRILEHVESNLVMKPLGEDRTGEFPRGGDTFNITIEAEPALASAVAESSDLSVTTYAPTQAQLTPSEIGLAHQISDKEFRRAFYNVMERMVKNLGYSIAKKVDEDILDTITAGAGNAVVANDVASSDLASSDTLDHLDVLRGMEENAKDEHDNHVALICRPEQVKDLTSDSSFLTADKFGPEAGVLRGFVGRVFGIPVLMTTQVDISSNAAKAVLLSADDAFAYIFLTPENGVVKMDYDVLGRFHTIGAHVDFDSVVTRANAICTIESWV